MRLITDDTGADAIGNESTKAQRSPQSANASVIAVPSNFGIIGNFADIVAVMFRGKIVEYGPTKEILGNPQHAYTKALIQCIPCLGAKRKRLVTIDHAALEAAGA